MKKKLCILCSNTEGKRACQIKENALICPVCCAKIRTTDCEGCVFYAQAGKFKKEKSLTPKPRPFMMAIERSVDEKADRALALAEKGDIRRAEETLISLLNSHPQNAMVQFGMGVIHVMKDRYAEAILYFDKAIEINPYFVEAWYNKGSAHQKRLEIQPMIKAFRKVIELGDSSEHYVIQTKSMIRGFEKDLRDEMNLSLDAYLAGMNIFNEAFSAMEKMEWEKAILGFKKVLSIIPKHVQSNGNLGVCYGHLGMKQEALAYLDRALELDADYEPAIMNRAAIAALAEGVKLQAKHFGTIEFYKDFKSKNKSLVDMKFGR